MLQQSVSSQKPSITAKVSSESQSAKSGNEVVLKASSQSSSATSSVASSSQSSSAASSVASSSSSKTDSKKTSSQSSVKDSSQNSKKNEANATSAVNTLENDANKYQDSSDAVTQPYAEEAQQWLSNLQTFMNGKDLSSPSELNDEINFLKNDMKSLQDTLNASWFNGSPEAKQIMQDQINADKAVLAYLTGQGQDTQSATSTPSKKNDVKTFVKKESSNNSNGVKKNVAKATTDVKHQATVSTKATKQTQTTVSAEKTITKQTTVNSATKKASMPQTGETNDAGILATIGALTIAAAGAFLFRKRG